MKLINQEIKALILIPFLSSLLVLLLLKALKIIKLICSVIFTNLLNIFVFKNIQINFTANINLLISQSIKILI
jgi:hypothetical protein